jgi:hypothetical protein
MNTWKGVTRFLCRPLRGRVTSKKGKIPRLRRGLFPALGIETGEALTLHTEQHTLRHDAAE